MRKVIILVILFPQIIFTQDILQVLDFDLQQGELNYEDYLVYKALAIYDPQKLPSNYRNFITELPMKSGTFIVHEIKSNWNKLSPSNQNLLKPFLTRPDLPFNYPSPSGQFRIHYTTFGADAVSTKDTDLDGIPDYVEQTAEIFDYCHHYEVDTLGYHPPPSDLGNGGGDEYDIYIKNFYKVYGQTKWEAEAPGKPNTFYSYMEIDNNYTGFPTSGLNGLRVTAAHEYFHAIQMGYKFKDDYTFLHDEVFYYEISSTWMEDVIYDDINDYYFYLHYFFNEINHPFYTYNERYEYGNCVWNHMLCKKYGPDLIREIWDEIVNYPVIEAMDRMLQRRGSSFSREFSNYSIWNYFTGSRQDSINYYPEGINYPEVSFALDVKFNSDTTITGTSSQLSFAYYNFYDTEYGNTITLIPVNLEHNSFSNSESIFALEVSRYSSLSFQKIAKKFNVNLIVEKPLVWNVRAIVTDAYGNRYIDSMNEELLVSFGPNPFKPRKHPSFNVYCYLQNHNIISVTIFTENGYKIGELKGSASESNKFSWDQNELGPFPGGSGIYLFLVQTDHSEEIFKFAVIK